MYDPNSTAFWDRADLDGELDRVYDICHQCRLCFNLCPSFPILFSAVDRSDDEIDNLTPEDHRQIVDNCWQCKICYVKCPYTPPHDWMIDFPRLLIRAKAVRAKEEGISFRDRKLADSEGLGKLGVAAWPVSNWANELKVHRWFMDQALGVHPEKRLPPFAEETFQEWFHRKQRDEWEAEPEAEDKVALFWTCYSNYNDPGIAKAAVRVLHKSGVDVSGPPQRCCGQPALDSGDFDATKQMAEQNVASLLKEVRAGRTIIALNPTCSYMIKLEYPEIVGTDEAREVAANTRDLFEYLAGLLKAGRLNTDFQVGMGKISYHLPCHLQAQNMGYKTREVLAKLPKTRVLLNEKCTAHDGTWAMRTENFDTSMKYAAKSFKEIEDADPKLVVSDCPLASIQLEQGTGRKVYHPAEVLDAAYRGIKLESPIVAARKRQLPVIQ